MANTETKLWVIILCRFTFHLPHCRWKVAARAILVEPPHRSSLWRFNYNVPVNLRDDHLNCGGYDWQWTVHQGRCGICGDMWNGTQYHVDGGIFDSGIVVRSYKEGHYISITFEVSSNYLGYVEFRLCPRNSTKTLLQEACFDRYPLWIDESHGTRYYIGSRGGIHDIHIRLPGGLVCKQCVLQWKYKTGYRYNGQESCKCLGCGQQERYVNCADIEISPRDGWSTDGNMYHNNNTTSVIMNVTSIREIMPTRTTTFRNTTEFRMEPIRFIKNEMSTAVIDEVLTESSTSLSTSSATPSVTQTSVPSFIYSTFSKESLTPPFSVSAISTRSAVLATIYSTFSKESMTPNSSVAAISTPPAVPATPATPIARHDTMIVDNIRRKIVKQIDTATVNERNDAFISTANTVGQTPDERQPTVQEPKIFDTSVDAQVPTGVDTHTFPRVPNTQFVSVSNILDKLYPNFVEPLLLTLTQSRGSSLNLHGGCDVTSDDFRCQARGLYKQSPGISQWCEINCRVNNCVRFLCDCGCETTEKKHNSSCHAITQFKDVEGMDLWCRANCKIGYCPPNTCNVEDCLQQGNGE